VVNRADLQRLARDRLADAKILFAARRWSAAYYLAGYAVECALKACIAKLVKAEDFPDRALAERCWTHDLERLVVVADLKKDRDTDARSDADLSANWEIAKDWNESSRYARKGRADARRLLAAITDAKHGVLPWVKKRW
jgi:HEPN domain-containing protein